jgi:hypothetical protein
MRQRSYRAWRYRRRVLFCMRVPLTMGCILRRGQRPCGGSASHGFVRQSEHVDWCKEGGQYRQWHHGSRAQEQYGGGNWPTVGASARHTRLAVAARCGTLCADAALPRSLSHQPLCLRRKCPIADLLASLSGSHAERPFSSFA